MIYSVEGIASRRSHVASRIDTVLLSQGNAVFTSVLARIECRIVPLRKNNLALLGIYERFFIADWFSVLAIADEVIDRATHLRADHNFKVPDAIHLATAIVHKADVFLTGDQQLVRCPGLTVEVIA